MKTPFVGFQILKQSVPLGLVLERYGVLGRLHRSGDTLNGACPIHGGHNPTQFRADLSRNLWICFGDCQGGGSIVDFVSRMEQVGVRDAGLLIQRWFGVGPDDLQSAAMIPGATTRTLAVQWAAADERVRTNPPLRSVLAGLDTEHPYLTERGLDPETIATFGLGYCSRGWLKGWIAIPIHNPHGQLVACAGRWPGDPPEGQPRYRLPKGFHKSLELFNLHHALAAGTGQPWIVVEGFMGCMRVWQAGFGRVVALMGCRMSERQAELLVSAGGPEGQVVLMLDGDDAGQKGQAEIRARLSSRLQVQIVCLEKPGLQPDQLSPAQLTELLRWRE